MYRSLPLFLCLALLFTEHALSETPQQVVTKYQNYRTICSGLGYKDKSCPSKGVSVVAFQILLSKSIHLGNYQTIRFDTVRLNEGSGYDVKTGKFTAPEDGIYSFSWSVLAKSGKLLHTEIVKNGKNVAYNYANGNAVKSGYYLTSSSTINIKMKKKDQVWIRTYGRHGRYIHGGLWPSFSGFKL